MTAMQRPRVSVVMPAYKAAATIERSMRSVLEQTHPDVELLVVDDCSPDNGWAVVSRLASADARVVPIRLERNGGVANARNVGIANATGTYLAFLDSDDWWHPRKLEIQLAAMRETGAKLCYAGYQRVDEGGRVLSTVRPPPSIDHAAMLRSNRVGNLTGLYDRSLGDGSFPQVGHEDYVFWLQMIRRAGRAVRADHAEPLAFYLVRSGSLSSDKLKAAGWQWKIYREHEGMGRMRAAWYFCQYAAIAMRKRA